MGAGLYGHKNLLHNHYLTTYVGKAYHSRMKRTTVWLTEQQLQKLKQQSKKTGLAIAELVRRFIDAGLQKGARQ